MFNSLKRNSRSKPALVRFVRNSPEDQENYWPPPQHYEPSYKNIMRHPNPNITYDTDSINCDRQSDRSYNPSSNNSVDFGYSNDFEANNPVNLLNYQRGTTSYLQDYNANEKSHERKNCKNKMKSRRPSGTKSLGQNSAFDPIPRNSKYERYFSQTGTVSKTVSGVMKKRKHIVFLGLDGSGKTTVLMQLKYKCFLATAPTVGFNHEKVWGGGFRWSVWDVGGGERLRPLWSTYTRGTDGIVFVMDASCSSDTMEENRLELARVMKVSKASSTQLNSPPPPVLVLANFQDNSFARCAPEVAECLSLPQEGPTNTSLWGVACVCATTGEGLDEAMATLRNLMDSNRKTKERWRF